MIIRSCYRDGASNQFEMEIVGEGIDSDFGEPCYFVKFLPKWQPIFQDGYGTHEIRKSLIGSLYELVEEERHEQLTLF